MSFPPSTDPDSLNWVIDFPSPLSAHGDYVVPRATNVPSSTSSFQSLHSPVLARNSLQPSFQQHGEVGASFLSLSHASDQNYCESTSSVGLEDMTSLRISSNPASKPGPFPGSPSSGASRSEPVAAGYISHQMAVFSQSDEHAVPWARGADPSGANLAAVGGVSGHRQPRAGAAAALTGYDAIHLGEQQHGTYIQHTFPSTASSSFVDSTRPSTQPSGFLTLQNTDFTNPFPSGPSSLTFETEGVFPVQSQNDASQTTPLLQVGSHSQPIDPRPSFVQLPLPTSSPSNQGASQFAQQTLTPRRLGQSNRAWVALGKVLQNSQQVIAPLPSEQIMGQRSHHEIQEQQELVPIQQSDLGKRQKTRVFCRDCSQDFMSKHEMQRHWKRVHAEEITRYKTCQPVHGPNVRYPKKPLSQCQKCHASKQYGNKDNVRAHLRRMHFNPRAKTGRKREPRSKPMPSGRMSPSAEELEVWFEPVYLISSQTPPQLADVDASGEEDHEDIPDSTCHQNPGEEDFFTQEFEMDSSNTAPDSQTIASDYATYPFAMAKANSRHF